MEATFELFEKTTTEFFNVSRDIRNISLDMLKKICDRTETKEISLDKFKNYLRDEGYCDPTIVYDGGNHPEYATNVFSTVDGFRIENEIVIFDIEDDPHYDESRVNTVDIIELCEMIIEYENKGYELGVKEYEDEEDEE
jgi:hypothetical protein